MQTYHYTPLMKDQILAAAQKTREDLENKIGTPGSFQFAWERTKAVERLQLIRDGLNAYYVHGDMTILTNLAVIKAGVVSIDLT